MDLFLYQLSSVTKLNILCDKTTVLRKNFFLYMFGLNLSVWTC